MTQTMVKEADGFTDTACRYLSLYLGEADWKTQIERLSRSKYVHSQEDTKKIIAAAVMLPTFDKYSITDPPENLLHWVGGYGQFKERDWLQLFKDQMKKDAEIEVTRNESLSLGIIYPIDYSPVTRQAFNLLYGKAKDAGVINEQSKADITKRFQNLVLAYGGNVICFVFQKHDHKVKKVLNWRTGYFFEQIIFDVFSKEQVLKIKKAELAKTNPKLVKKIRND